VYHGAASKITLFFFRTDDGESFFPFSPRGSAAICKCGRAFRPFLPSLFTPATTPKTGSPPPRLFKPTRRSSFFSPLVLREGRGYVRPFGPYFFFLENPTAGKISPSPFPPSGKKSGLKLPFFFSSFASVANKPAESFCPPPFLSSQPSPSLYSDSPPIGGSRFRTDVFFFLFLFPPFISAGTLDEIAVFACFFSPPAAPPF